MSDAPTPKSRTRRPSRAQRSAARSTAPQSSTSPDQADADPPASSQLHSRALWEQIRGRLADGESLLSICRDPGMPSDATVRRWVAEDLDGIAAEYARARGLGLDRIAEQIIEIADTASTVDTAAVHKAKLRIDSRRWLLAKLAPARYGERLEVNAAVSHQYSEMDDSALLAEARRLADRLGLDIPDHILGAMRTRTDDALH